MHEVELPWNLAVRAQDAEHLSVEVQLHNTVVDAVAHINRVVASGVGESPWSSDVTPLAYELSALIEDLNALIGPVGHVQATLCIEGDVVDQVKLGVGFALLSPMCDVVAVVVVL